MRSTEHTPAAATSTTTSSTPAIDRSLAQRKTSRNSPGITRRGGRTLAVTLAAAAVFGGTTLPASAAPSAQHRAHTAAATSAAYGKVYKNVWHTAPSYYSGLGGRTGGYVYAGRNYFYCQGVGEEYSALGYHNKWWLYTDDDNGHRNVWINAVYVSGGGNDQPIPGVRRC